MLNFLDAIDEALLAATVGSLFTLSIVMATVFVRLRRLEHLMVYLTRDVLMYMKRADTGRVIELREAVADPETPVVNLESPGQTIVIKRTGW